MNVDPNIVRKYYQGKDYKPWIPHNSSSYHFRVRCLDGSWKKITCRINHVQKLRKKLILLDAGDVYFSTAQWLNPVKVGYKDGPRGPGYVVSDTVMINNDLCVDFDADFDMKNVSLEGLEKTRKEALKLVKRMKDKRGFVRNYILFTGAKGFQISYSHDEKLPLNPVERYKKSLKNRKRYKKSFLKGIKYDEITTLNPFLVRRLPNTINIKTGYIATIISEEILRLPIKKLLTHIPYVTRSRPGIPRKREMTRHLRDIKKGLGGAAGLTPQPTPIISTGYTNQVLGAKDRYILLLEYGQGQKYEQDISFLQKHYNLSESYLLRGKEDDHYWIISLQTFPHKRLIKILNRTCALNKSQQKRLHHSQLPEQDYELIKVFYSDNPLKVASKTHRDLLRSLNIESWNWEGKEGLQISISVKGE